MPEHCTPVVTVQMANCQVNVVGRCGADDIIRSQIYDREGLRHVEELDDDWDLRFSVGSMGFPGVVVNGSPSDPMSKATLLETGEDRFDYPVILRGPGGDGQETDLTGTLEVLGETNVIDGHELMVLRFRYRIGATPSGQPFIADLGAFYSAEFGVFLNGAGNTGVGSADTFSDETPKEISRPGEAGFLNLRPVFGCEADFASLAASAAGQTREMSR